MCLKKIHNKIVQNKIITEAYSSCLAIIFSPVFIIAALVAITGPYVHDIRPYLTVASVSIPTTNLVVAIEHPIALSDNSKVKAPNENKINPYYSFDQAIDLNKKDDVAYNARGNAERENGDYTRAMKDLNEAVALNPQSSEYLCDLGTLHADIGNISEAREDYARAVTMDPDNIPISLQEAYSELLNHNPEKAEAIVKEVLDKSPTNATAIGTRGLIKKYNGDSLGSIVDYNSALQIDPNDELSLKKLGYGSFDIGDMDTSVSALQQIVRISPDYADHPRFYLWLIKSLKGDNSTAQTELKDYFYSSRNNVQDWNFQVARYLLDEITQDELSKAVDPNNAFIANHQLCEANFYIGCKYLLSDNKPLAKEYFEKSVETDDKVYAEYWSALACLVRIENDK